MDKKFQDKIDNFLLHESDMEQRCKDEFIRELSDDAAKREQYEFTLNVKRAIYSMESKREQLAIIHKNYLTNKKREKNLRLFKKIIIGGSSIAAIFVVGFFVFRPIQTPPKEFNPTIPVFSPEKAAAPKRSTGLKSDGNLNCLSDSVVSDSISDDSIIQELIEDELSWDKIMSE